MTLCNTVSERIKVADCVIGAKASLRYRVRTTVKSIQNACRHLMYPSAI